MQSCQPAFGGHFCLENSLLHKRVTCIRRTSTWHLRWLLTTSDKAHFDVGLLRFNAHTLCTRIELATNSICTLEMAKVQKHICYISRQVSSPLQHAKFVRHVIKKTVLWLEILHNGLHMHKTAFFSYIFENFCLMRHSKENYLFLSMTQSVEPKRRHLKAARFQATSTLRPNCVFRPSHVKHNQHFVLCVLG